MSNITFCQARFPQFTDFSSYATFSTSWNFDNFLHMRSFFNKKKGTKTKKLICSIFVWKSYNWSNLTGAFFERIWLFFQLFHHCFQMTKPCSAVEKKLWVAGVARHYAHACAHASWYVMRVFKLLAQMTRELMWKGDTFELGAGTWPLLWFTFFFHHIVKMIKMLVIFISVQRKEVLRTVWLHFHV